MISQKALIEGVLFASQHPVSARTLSEILECPVEEIKAGLEEIKTSYENENHGFFLAEVAGGFQFRTKTELKDVMARLYEKKPPKLTQATLEVLSVIAYKQPVTRPTIEKIRGVDCTGVLKTLLERDLIQMIGRSDLPGNPVIYGTTQKFLEWFQIKEVSDLPPLSEMEALNHNVMEEGTDHLLGLLNRDDGFQAEIGEVDEVLTEINRHKQEVQVPWEAPQEAEGAVTAAPASEGASEKPAEV